MTHINPNLSYEKLYTSLRSAFGFEPDIKSRVRYSPLTQTTTVYITIDGNLFTFETDDLNHFLGNLPKTIYADYPELLI